MNFKEEYDEDARLRESKKIIHKYPSRIPIIVEKHDSCQFQIMNKKNIWHQKI